MARLMKGTKIRHMSREARLALACEGSKRYKGVRYPRCNDEHPCKSCLKIYVDKHPADRGEDQGVQTKTQPT
jgi:hypothetical protein